MKKIYLFLLFLPLLSCNDWLDISPENSVTLTNYFQSEADLESLHTSMMARMKSACKGKQPYYYMSVDADELKPNISGWEADFGKEMMTKGKAWLNFTWSGDAVWAMEEASAVGVDLGYEVPLEGSNIWYDGWAIPKYARNVKAASYFMNYLCRPDIVSRNMEVTGYVSTVATPEILAEKIDTTLTEFSDVSYFFGPGAERIQIDPAQYPDRKVVERCAMIRDSGERTEAVLEMWSRVKGDNLGLGIVVVIFVSVGVMLVYTVYRRIQRYQHEKLQRRRRRHRKRR